MSKFKINERIKDIDDEETLGPATVIGVEDDYIVVQYDKDDTQVHISTEDQERYDPYPYAKED